MFVKDRAVGKISKPAKITLCDLIYCFSVVIVFFGSKTDKSQSENSQKTEKYLKWR
jgi:hypothetical protein